MTTEKTLVLPASQDQSQTTELKIVESIIRYAQNNDSDRQKIKSGLKKYFGEFARYID